MVEKLPTTNNWTRVREKPQNLVHTEESASTQPVHTCTTEYKIWWTEWPWLNQLEGRTRQRKTQQQSKPKDIQRANINDNPRSASSGDQGDCTTESQRSSTIEVHTINLGSQNRSIWEAEANKKSLTNNGKTKKQSPNERKGGSPRKNANWNRGKSTIRYWVKSNGYKEAQWAHRELPKLQGNYNEFTVNYINIKKEIETINKRQEEMKNTISEVKNTVEEWKADLMKQRIGSASWRTK